MKRNTESERGNREGEKTINFPSLAMIIAAATNECLLIILIKTCEKHIAQQIRPKRIFNGFWYQLWKIAHKVLGGTIRVASALAIVLNTCMKHVWLVCVLLWTKWHSIQVKCLLPHSFEFQFLFLNIIICLSGWTLYVSIVFFLCVVGWPFCRCRYFSVFVVYVA